MDHNGIKWDQMEQNGTKWIKWRKMEPKLNQMEQNGRIWHKSNNGTKWKRMDTLA